MTSILRRVEPPVVDLPDHPRSSRRVRPREVRARHSRRTKIARGSSIKVEHIVRVTIPPKISIPAPRSRARGDHRGGAMKGPLRALLVFGFVVVVGVLAMAYPLLDSAREWLGVTWQNPWFLLLLVVVPVVLWRGTSGEDVRTPRLRIGTVAPLVLGPRGCRAWLRDLPGVVRAVALALLVLAMARPGLVLRDQSTDEKGIDIVVVLDLSGSMRAVLDADSEDLARHAEPRSGKRLTRLDTAKIVIRDFIGRRKTDRIGVVVFGKAAYVLSPPTLDYHLLDTLVEQDDARRHRRQRDGDRRRGRHRRGAPPPERRAIQGHHPAHRRRLQRRIDRARIRRAPRARSWAPRSTRSRSATATRSTSQEGIDCSASRTTCAQRFPVNPELLKKHGDARRAAKRTSRPTRRRSRRACTTCSTSSRRRASRRRRASFEDLFPFLLLPGVVLVALDALLRALAPPEVPVNFARPHLALAAPLFALVVAALLVARRRSRRGRRDRSVRRSRARRARSSPLDPAKRRALEGRARSSSPSALAFVAVARPQYGRGTRLIPATNLDVVDRARLLEEHVRARRRAVAHRPRQGRGRAARSRARRARASPRSRSPASRWASRSPRDGAAIAQFFRQLEPNDMPVGGTAIARALERARELLARDPEVEGAQSASSCSSPTAKTSRAIRWPSRDAAGAEGTRDRRRADRRPHARAHPRGRPRRQDRAASARTKTGKPLTTAALGRGRGAARRRSPRRRRAARSCAPRRATTGIDTVAPS